MLTCIMAIDVFTMVATVNAGVQLTGLSVVLCHQVTVAVDHLTTVLCSIA